MTASTLSSTTWMRPLASRRRPPWRPVRVPTISARMEIAVSSGVCAPMSSPTGPGDALQLLVRDARGAQAVAALLLRAARAERSDVADAAAQRACDRRVVQLGIVREHDDVILGPEVDLVVALLGPLDDELAGRRDALGGRERAPRIDHDRAPAERGGHAAERVGRVHRADHHEARRRHERLGEEQRAVVEHHRLVALGRDRLLAGGEDGLHQLVGRLAADSLLGHEEVLARVVAVDHGHARGARLRPASPSRRSARPRSRSRRRRRGRRPRPRRRRCRRTAASAARPRARSGPPRRPRPRRIRPRRSPPSHRASRRRTSRPAGAAPRGACARRWPVPRRRRASARGLRCGAFRRSCAVLTAYRLAASAALRRSPPAPRPASPAHAGCGRAGSRRRTAARPACRRPAAGSPRRRPAGSSRRRGEPPGAGAASARRAASGRRAPSRRRRSRRSRRA